MDHCIFFFSFSVEYTETSGYIAAMFDEEIPEEVVIGDEKTYSSEYKKIKDKVQTKLQLNQLMDKMQKLKYTLKKVGQG